MKDILAEMTFQARSSSEINQHSGVSCRVSIRSYEAILGSAVRRCLELGETVAVPRITDIEMTYPAISGKLELEYQVQENNGNDIVDNLAHRAIKSVFDTHFQIDGLAEIIAAFEKGMSVEISRFQPSDAYLDGLKYIPGMEAAVERLADLKDAPQVAAALEFVLEGLHLSNKLNREAHENGVLYK